MHPPTSLAISELGSWVAELTWDNVPDDVRDRHQLIWADYLTVACAGAQLPEYMALIDVWALPDGSVPIPGTAIATAAEQAAWIMGTVGVALEQDEGNKFAKGHPAAHVIPAVLSLAISRGATGEQCALAVVAGYEVAARFGRATTLNAGVHPHGNWGVAAAAAGCAKLLGLNAEAIAAAIDHGSGMGVAGHFSSALDGNLVRNSWMGAAQISGIASAYLAAAGVATNTGTADPVLGGILGAWDLAPLTEELGFRWDARSNYFKVHAACAFTHPPIDAVLALTNENPDLRDIPVEDIAAITVYTHYLAAGLSASDPKSRLSAMFSIPYVVAVALRQGQVTPREHSIDSLHDTDVQALAAKVAVCHDAAMSERLPAERVARVRVEFVNGTVLEHEVPNPIGDSDYAPLKSDDLRDKGQRLVAAALVEQVWSFAEQLPSATSVADIAPLLQWTKQD